MSDPNDHLDQVSDTPDTATLIQRYLNGAGGRVVDAAPAATADRMADPMNLPLRNAEHALFSQSVIDQLGPIVGRAVAGTAVPAYSAAKAVAQALPTPVGQAIDRIAPFKLAGATPPSLDEIRWGLRPVWGSIASQSANTSQNPYANLLQFLGAIR
jgi:hypothetical protein